MKEFEIVFEEIQTVLIIFVKNKRNKVNQKGT